MAVLTTRKCRSWFALFLISAWLFYPFYGCAGYPSEKGERSGLVGHARPDAGYADFGKKGFEIRGIYGVPSIAELDPLSYMTHMERAGVNAVFVPPDWDTVAWFKKRGFRTYVSVNAFGGKEAWKLYPEARPIMGDGRLLGEGPDSKGYGGVCPTHQEWRQDRLKHVAKLVDELGGEGGIDGVWLDFIRYPGLWEDPDPFVPDTCYCERCLKAFQRDTGVSLPGGLGTGEAAVWIRNNCRYQWMKWKKRQIASFVEEVRNIVHAASAEGTMELGVFLVPWTKGERDNDISYQLAQDACELSAIADVLSPMVYHKMVGQAESWAGYMTQYYGENARSQIVPIVQSLDCTPEEFRTVLRAIGQSNPDGFLVYSFRDMMPDLWAGLDAFQAPQNLITNPVFATREGEGAPGGWHTGNPGRKTVEESLFFLKPSDRFEIKGEEIFPSEPSICLGIFAGNDRAGKWCSPLRPCETGQEYTFTCLLYRDIWQNGVYPSIRLWGEEFPINTHWQSHRFQPIRLRVRCPPRHQEDAFCFVNDEPGHTFWLTRPYLAESQTIHATSPAQTKPHFFRESFFPIGVFGAQLNHLDEIRKTGFNTVLLGGQGKELRKAIIKCHELGLGYVIAVPRDPDRLVPFLDQIEKVALPPFRAFYVNDEPGIHTFPIGTANDIHRLIKERFPDAATCMAVVRPQVCRDYADAADFFMMDQYPVPHMPMTWLSDSMEEAGTDVGKDRLASIIQAFGGEKWAYAGWPRFPTWQEMDCLAFLSIVHGSKAVFFYTFSEIGKNQEGLKGVKKVVGRLNRLYGWLLEENCPKTIVVDMVSPYRSDPKGRPAVQCCVKRRRNELLLVAVNTIGTYVEANIDLGISGDQAFGPCKEVFSEASYPANEGSLRARFGPYEVKAFLFSETGG